MRAQWRDRWSDYLGMVLLVVAFVGMVWFLHVHFPHLLNSDDGSELILSRLLADKNQLLSPDWYYSTELRVLNSQIVFATLFKFIDSWHWVRVIGTAVIYVLFVASYWFFCHAFRCQQYFWLTAVLLLVPFSGLWFDIILRVPYYVPYITVMFVSLGLCELCIRCEKTQTRRLLWLMMCAVAVAVISCMNGPRQLVVSYLPLALVAGLMFLGDCVVPKVATAAEALSKRRFYLSVVVSLAGALVGYGINHWLGHYYSFLKWENINFRLLDLSRLQMVVNGMFEGLGFSASAVSLRTLFANGLCFAIIFFSAIAVLSLVKRHREDGGAFGRLGYFCLAAFSVYVLLYCFTDMSHTGRYSLPLIVLFIPLIAYGCSVLIAGPLVRPLAALFVVLVFVNGVMYCVDRGHWRSELPQVAKTLVAKGYENGYAMFWTGNVLTELSNGKLEMHVWADGQDCLGVSDVDQTMHWLQKKEHEVVHAAGRVFVILTTRQDQYNNWPGLKAQGRIEYQSPGLVVYGFNSYEALVTATEGTHEWNAASLPHPPTTQIQAEGAVSQSEGEATLTFGPYVTLREGTYEVSFDYRSPRTPDQVAGRWDIVTDLGARGLAQGALMGTSDAEASAKVTLALDQKTTKLEFRTFSAGAKTLAVKAIHVKRLH